MNYYHDKHFILQDGSLNNKIISKFIYRLSHSYVYWNDAYLCTILCI